MSAAKRVSIPQGLISNFEAPESPSIAQDSASPAEWDILQHEVSRYIASMTGEMANMARSAKLDLLVYFLEMAYVEAAAQAKRSHD
jgi:hypothetical protein